MAIVSRSSHKVRTSEEFSSSDFRIEASPEAFRILSDGLYSNKVKAVIRELSTNAVDSLIDADSVNWGYEVHLPTHMEAEFSIRDYGTGLSHEDVIGLYTTYFGSNKTHSNNFTGQLGLGSKSPFAYIDSFNITSWHGGMKRCYNAHISEDGYPAISLLCEEPISNSTDRTGMEIKFPVKKEDIYSFEEEAEKVYKYFSILPTLTGKQITIEEPEKTLSGTGWYLNKSRHRSDKAIAVMGNISYPIDHLDSDNKAYDNLLDTGIVLNFDIGDLDITPSRESLSMTKRTIANIKSRLDFVILEVKDEVQSKFNDCENLWDARCISSELFGSWNSPLYHLGNVCQLADISFQGDPIQIDTSVSLSKLTGVSVYKFHRRNSWRSQSSVHRENTLSLPCDREATFFLDDLSGAGAYSRCKEHTETTRNECYLIRFSAGGVKNDSKVKDIFLEFTGMDESLLLSVSDLPKPTRFSSRRGSGTGVRKDKVLLFDKQNITGSSKSDYWDSCDVDFDAGGIYVEISRYKVVDAPLDDPFGLHKLIESLDEICDDDINVYGVKTANVHRYEKSEDWVSLWDYISEYIDTNMKHEHKLLMQKKINMGVLYQLNFEYSVFISIYKYLKSDTEFKILCKVFADMRQSAERDDLKSLASVVDRANIDYSGTIEPISSREHLEAKYEEALEKYPILKVAFANELSWSSEAFQSFGEDHWKIVADYVEQTK